MALVQIPTPSAGGMTLLASGDLTGGGVVSITGIPQSYRDLKVILKNYKPNTTATKLGMRINNVDASASYAWSNVRVGNATLDVSSSSTILQLNYDTVVTDSTGQQMTVIIDNYADTSTRKFVLAYGFARTTQATLHSGYMVNIEAVTSLQFFFSGTTFGAGTYEVYGVK